MLNFREILKSTQTFHGGLCNLTQYMSNSSVAMILRKRVIKQGNSQHDILDYDLLFLQRKITQKDIYSGQICFPGGKRQFGQSIIETAIRQTKQEVGLQLKQQNYIATFPKPFAIYQSSKNIHLTSIIIFQIFADEKGNYQNLTVNSEEISDYKWVSIKELLQQNKDKNKKFISFDGFKKFPYAKTIPDELQNKQDQLNKYYKALHFPYMDIGMKKVVFGFTYYSIMTIAYQIFCFLLKRGQINEQTKRKLNKIFIYSIQSNVTMKQECPNKDEYQKIASTAFQDANKFYTGILPKL